MGGLPALLSIDIEPDRRSRARAERVPWDGWDAAYERFTRLRPALAEATGCAVRLGWYVRTDPQIADAWGSASHAIDAHRDRIDALRAHGDEIGVHFHPFRWDEEAGEAVCDFADAAWVADALDATLDAFARAVGTPCRSFRFGARWRDEATLAQLARRGVAHELSAEPGFAGGTHVPSDERYAGDFPDFREAPRHPHRERCGVWTIPVSTASPERRWKALRRVVAGTLLGRRRPRPWVALDLTEPPRLFLRALDRLLASRATRHLQAVVRCDGLLGGRRAHVEANLDGLLARSRAHALRFVRPDELVSALASRAAASPPAAP